MNRQQRRAYARNNYYRTGDLDRLLKEQDARTAAKQRLEKNGITVEDLEENFNKGYKAGVGDTVEIMSKSAYAAAVLALKREFGFGTKRMLKFITAMDNLMVTCIDREDMIAEACQETGIVFRPEAGVDRFSEV